MLFQQIIFVKGKYVFMIDLKILQFQLTHTLLHATWDIGQSRNT